MVFQINIIQIISITQVETTHKGSSKHMIYH
jgi:hypothetical protein